MTLLPGETRRKKAEEGEEAKKSCDFRQKFHRGALQPDPIGNYGNLEHKFMPQKL